MSADPISKKMCTYGFSPSSSWSCAPTIPDFVSLELDGNGGSTLGESGKDIDLIMSYLAEVIKSKWSEDSERMTYKDWVQKVRYPGNKHDKTNKALHEAAVAKFLEFLEESNHPSYAKAREMYDAVAQKYLNPQTGKVDFQIFPCLIDLIQRLEKICRCSKTLRTFGKDGQKIAEGFTKAGIPMSKRVTMIPTIGMLVEGGNQEVITGPRLLETRQQEMALIGKDQFNLWQEHGGTASWGKEIPCVADALFKGKTFVTIFIDDNLKKLKKSKEEGKEEQADPNEPNIAYPKDVYGKPVSWRSPGAIGIHMNPLKAALDYEGGLYHGYLRRKVNKEFAKRGFVQI